jgi:hypothetical protein
MKDAGNQEYESFIGDIKEVFSKYEYDFKDEFGEYLYRKYQQNLKENDDSDINELISLLEIIKKSKGGITVSSCAYKDKIAISNKNNIELLELFVSNIISKRYNGLLKFLNQYPDNMNDPYGFNFFKPLTEEQLKKLHIIITYSDKIKLNKLKGYQAKDLIDKLCQSGILCVDIYGKNREGVVPQYAFVYDLMGKIGFGNNECANSTEKYNCLNDWIKAYIKEFGKPKAKWTREDLIKNLKA